MNQSDTADTVASHPVHVVETEVSEGRLEVAVHVSTSAMKETDRKTERTDIHSQNRNLV